MSAMTKRMTQAKRTAMTTMHGPGSAGRRAADPAGGEKGAGARFVGVGLLALAAMLAAGCGILPKKEPLALYAPEAGIRADPSWPSVDWQLQLPRPHAAELLDSPRIVVRPAPGELQVYKGAVWTQPAPDLVQDALLRAFDDSGRIAGAARRGSGVTGDFELLLELRRFDSDYAGGSPAAVVELGAKLVSARENRVVASRAFRASAPSAATDVAAVSRAFGTALGQVAAEVVGWTLVEGERHHAPAPAAR
jgi:cholesterol transport system auxiliary component